jgi:hypothetical protein
MRAKEVQRVAEKLITRARGGSLHDRRLVISKMPYKAVFLKLFDEIAPRYAGRPGDTRDHQDGISHGRRVTPRQYSNWSSKSCGMVRCVRFGVWDTLTPERSPPALTEFTPTFPLWCLDSASGEQRFRKVHVCPHVECPADSHAGQLCRVGL